MNFKHFFESVAEPTKLSVEIPMDSNIYILSDALKQGDSSVKVYVVGGAVRDFLYNLYHNKNQAFKPKDFDITTNLSEEEILNKLRSKYAVEKGISVKEKTSVDTFGVVFATVNGINYEVAPFRKDIGISDGRRPDRVERGDISDDAMRRDLTINNLYYDFENKQILDFNTNGQGLKDIKDKKVNAVGNPLDRFNEDKLRIIRMVRFFSRFNDGNIADHLDETHKKAIDAFKSLPGISPERIQMEFVNGIKQSLNTSGFISSLISLGLTSRMFPNMNINPDIAKIGNSKNVKVILAWMFKNDQNVEKNLNKLKYPNDISESVQFLINTIHFGPETALQIIKNRDKRLLKPNDRVTELQAQQHNQQIIENNTKDLTELAKLLDPITAKKIMHLIQYQMPKIDTAALSAKYTGPALGQEISRQVTSDYDNSFRKFVNDGI